MLYYANSLNVTYIWFRVLSEMEKMLQSGSVDMEWLIPQEVCVMINVICQADEQVIVSESKI